MSDSPADTPSDQLTDPAPDASPDPEVAGAPAPGSSRTGFRGRLGDHLGRGLDRDTWPDLVLGALVTLATFVVHDVGYMLSAPYWNDEAWVAISTKLPLHQLTTVAASTPVGWDLLLRLISFGQDPSLRIVPLLFSALTVAAAYAFVRSLPWPGTSLARIAAVLGALTALLAPSALLRDDLKQYTADAFVTVLILWLVTRLENDRTRRRLVTLGVVIVVGFLFSAVAVFVGAAAFACVLLMDLVRRRRTEVIETLVVGAASGVVLIGTFLVLYRPGIPAGLNTYWAAYYLPISKGWGPTWQFLHGHGDQMALYLGMGPLLVAILLVAVGVVTLFRLRRFSVALLVPVLLAEMVVLGALKQYPLFDLRTSHFLTTAFGVTAAIGIAGICSLVARIHLSLAFIAAALAVVLFVTGSGVRGNLRSHSIPNEDLRTPTTYLAAHRQPGDIIVVATLSNWGFAYYWVGAPGGGGTPGIRHVTANLQGFVTVFPDQPNILVAVDRDRASVAAIMDEAAAAAAKAVPAARIWVVHVHNTGPELKAYADAAKAHGFTRKAVVGTGLDLLTPTG